MYSCYYVCGNGLDDVVLSGVNRLSKASFWLCVYLCASFLSLPTTECCHEFVHFLWTERNVLYILYMLYKDHNLLTPTVQSVTPIAWNFYNASSTVLCISDVCIL